MSCIERVKRMTGTTLSDKKLSDIRNQVEKDITYLKEDLSPADFDSAVQNMTEARVARTIEVAKIKQRNTLLNAMKVERSVAHLEEVWSDKLVEGLSSYLVGSNRARQGARYSVAAEQLHAKDEFMGTMIRNIEADLHGGHKLLASGKHDADIIKALWYMDIAPDRLSELPKDVVTISKHIHAMQETVRGEMNKAGAWIGKLPGYILSQSHNMDKIRKTDAGEYTRDLASWLDIGKSFGVTADGDLTEALTKIYLNFKSGNHMTADGGMGTGSKASGASQERVLHFKGPDEFYAYMQKYGHSRVRDSLGMTMQAAGQSLGLMRVLGPDPRGTFQKMVFAANDIARKNGDDKQMKAIDEAFDEGSLLDRQMKTVDGSSNKPGSAMWAGIWSSVRKVKNMATLGGSVFAAVADVPNYASEVRYQGRGYFHGLKEAFGGVTNIKNQQEKTRIAASLGVLTDHLRGGLFDIGDDMSPGKLTSLQRIFFKANLLTPWTDRLRISAILGNSNWLARNADVAFNQIESDTVRALSLYDIGENEWAVLRKATDIAEDGERYMLPEKIQTLPDADIAAYAKKSGLESAGEGLERTRADLESRLRAYYVDRTSFAALEPGAREQAAMLQGTKPGTFIGEMTRMVMQFKSFMFAQVMKPLSREVFGRSTDATWANAIKGGNGEVLGLVNLMVGLTGMGYVAMSLKDVAKGREPRNPDDVKTWIAAFIQGGGAGIYGDFLFGEMKSRFGRGPIAEFAGPVLGTGSDIIDLYSRAVRGDDFAGKSLKTLINNTPFVNLFWTRPAIDYLILHRISEAVNPGYLRRMEKRIKKENNQEFIIRPSEVIPRGGF
jgi:hypothetical protein